MDEYNFDDIYAMQDAIGENEAYEDIEAELEEYDDTLENVVETTEELTDSTEELGKTVEDTSQSFEGAANSVEQYNKAINQFNSANVKILTDLNTVNKAVKTTAENITNLGNAYYNLGTEASNPETLDSIEELKTGLESLKESAEKFTNPMEAAKKLVSGFGTSTGTLAKNLEKYNQQAPDSITYTQYYTIALNDLNKVLNTYIELKQKEYTLESDLNKLRKGKKKKTSENLEKEAELRAKASGLPIINRDINSETGTITETPSTSITQTPEILSAEESDVSKNLPKVEEADIEKIESLHQEVTEELRKQEELRLKDLEIFNKKVDKELKKTKEQINKIYSEMLVDTVNTTKTVFDSVGLNTKKIESILGKGFGISKDLNNLGKNLKALGKISVTTGKQGGKALTTLGGVASKLGAVAAVATVIIGVFTAMAEAGKYAYQRNLEVNRSLMSMGANTSELNSTTADTANRLIDIKNTWIRIGEDLGRIFQPVFEGLITIVDWLSKAVETVTGTISGGLTDEKQDRQKQYTSSDNKVRWYTSALEEKSGIPESKSVPTIGGIASTAKQSGFDNTSAANLAVGTYSEALKIAKQYGIEADEVAKKLANAWQTGSKEAKEYGVVVDDITLKGYMASKGVDIVNVTITDAMKQYYRYQLMLEELSDSNSDNMQKQIKQWKQLGTIIDSTKNKLFSFDEVINLQAVDTTIPEVGRPNDVYYGDESISKPTPEPTPGPDITSVPISITDNIESLKVVIEQGIQSIRNSIQEASNKIQEAINKNIQNNQQNNIENSFNTETTNIEDSLNEENITNNNNENTVNNETTNIDNSIENTNIDNSIETTNIDNSIETTNIDNSVQNITNNEIDANKLDSLEQAIEENTEALTQNKNNINNNTQQQKNNITETEKNTTTTQQNTDIVSQSSTDLINTAPELIDINNQSAAAINANNNTNTQQTVDSINTNTESASVNSENIISNIDIGFPTIFDLLLDGGDALTAVVDALGGWEAAKEKGVLELAIDWGVTFVGGAFASAAQIGGNIGNNIDLGLIDSINKFKSAETFGDYVEAFISVPLNQGAAAFNSFKDVAQYTLGDVAADTVGMGRILNQLAETNSKVWEPFGEGGKKVASVMTSIVNPALGAFMVAQNNLGLKTEDIEKGFKKTQDAIEEWSVAGVRATQAQMDAVSKEVTGVEGLKFSWLDLAKTDVTPKVDINPLNKLIDLTKETDAGLEKITGVKTSEILVKTTGMEKVSNYYKNEFSKITGQHQSDLDGKVQGQKQVEDYNKNLKEAEGKHKSTIETETKGTEKIEKYKKWMGDTVGLHNSTIETDVKGTEKTDKYKETLKETTGLKESKVIVDVKGLDVLEKTNQLLNNTKGTYVATSVLKVEGLAGTQAAHKELLETERDYISNSIMKVTDLNKTQEAHKWLKDTEGDWISTSVMKVQDFDKIQSTHNYLEEISHDYNATFVLKVTGLNQVREAANLIRGWSRDYPATLQMKKRGDEIFSEIERRMRKLADGVNALTGSNIHFAHGGIGTKEINNATLFENNKKEAVIPLESQEGIDFLAAAMNKANENNNSGQGGGGSSVTINLTLQGIFDTDDRGKWEQLAEKLAETITIQEQRRGSLGYGASY